MQTATYPTISSISVFLSPNFYWREETKVEAFVKIYKLLFGHMAPVRLDFNVVDEQHDEITAFHDPINRKSGRKKPQPNAHFLGNGGPIDGQKKNVGRQVNS